jgi:hypothetical protein
MTTTGDIMTDPARPHLGGYVVGGDPHTYETAVWEYLHARFKVKTLLDIGAGEGHCLKWWMGHDQDIECVCGIEGLWNHSLANLGWESVVAEFRVEWHDYTEGPCHLNRDYDLGWCMEVVEHVEERYFPNLLSTFFTCKTLALSHAAPEQEGHHHVNCRTAEYWIDALKPWFALAFVPTLRCRELAQGHGKRLLVFHRV